MCVLRSCVASGIALIVFAFSLATARGAEESSAITVAEKPGQLEISIGGKPFAKYVYRDEKILRPYFANVHSPSGIPMTRTHPPQPGVDPEDHADMHPGIWLAFGDINGADFWRNKGRAETELAIKPSIEPGYLGFGVMNRYIDGDTTICRETCTYHLFVRPEGYLLLSSSTFEPASDKAAEFGDQEEMGLGFRVASPLRVKGGNGRMTSSNGKVNESEIRGTTANWVDYSGEVDGQQVGLTLMQGPLSFRKAWYHARDYGLLVANPFGRNALTGGEKSKVRVEPGDHIVLQYGVLIHSSPKDKPVDLKAAYAEFLQLAH